MADEMSEPENVELRKGDDGIARWYLATREGWQVVGCENGQVLTLDAAHYATGTKIELVEPIVSARRVQAPSESGEEG